MFRSAFRTLDRNIGYPVLEIATPLEELYFWTENLEQQEQVLKQTKDADITYFPLRQDEKITGLVHRDEREPIPLTADWLIAADTPILHLIELFAEKPERVFLVLKSSQIAGLVSPADLNKIPARASIYLLTAQFEDNLARLVKSELNEDEAELKKLLTAERQEKLRGKISNNERDEVEDMLEISLFYQLYLTDLFAIITKHPQLQKRLGFPSGKQAETYLNFADVRNSVSHPVRKLLNSVNDLERINSACDKMIELSQRMNTQHE